MENKPPSKKAIILGISWIISKIIVTICITALALIGALNCLFKTNITLSLDTFMATAFFVLCFRIHKNLFGIK